MSTALRPNARTVAISYILIIIMHNVGYGAYCILGMSTLSPALRPSARIVAISYTCTCIMGATLVYWLRARSLSLLAICVCVTYYVYWLFACVGYWCVLTVCCVPCVYWLFVFAAAMLWPGGQLATLCSRRWWKSGPCGVTNQLIPLQEECTCMASDDS